MRGLTLILKLALLLGLTGASVAQKTYQPAGDPVMTHSVLMEWVQTDAIQSIYFNAAPGSLVTVQLQCGLNFCGTPALVYGLDEFKFDQARIWHTGAPGNLATGQLFSIVVPRDGKVRLIVPTVYRGVLYKALVVVSRGPQPD